MENYTLVDDREDVAGMRRIAVICTRTRLAYELHGQMMTRKVMEYKRGYTKLSEVDQTFSWRFELLTGRFQGLLGIPLGGSFMAGEQ